jgi:hypothetical protein
VPRLLAPRMGSQALRFAFSSFRYRRRNSFQRSTRWSNHFRSSVLGATSFTHSSFTRSSFFMPRGQRRSTRIRRPSPRAGGSYVRLIRIKSRGPLRAPQL